MNTLSWLLYLAAIAPSFASTIKGIGMTAVAPAIGILAGAFLIPLLLTTIVQIVKMTY